MQVTRRALEKYLLFDKQVEPYVLEYTNSFFKNITTEFHREWGIPPQKPAKRILQKPKRTRQRIQEQKAGQQ